VSSLTSNPKKYSVSIDDRSVTSLQKPKEV
jgi:hypothetical protein